MSMNDNVLYETFSSPKARLFKIKKSHELARTTLPLFLFGLVICSIIIAMACGWVIAGIGTKENLWGFLGIVPFLVVLWFIQMGYSYPKYYATFDVIVTSDKIYLPSNRIRASITREYATISLKDIEQIYQSEDSYVIFFKKRNDISVLPHSFGKELIHEPESFRKTITKIGIWGSYIDHKEAISIFNELWILTKKGECKLSPMTYRKGPPLEV